MEPVRAGQNKAHGARRAALLVAAGLVVASAWLLVPDPPGSAAVDDERAVASSEGDETFVQLTAIDASASTRLAAETPASSRVEVEARAPVTSAKPARPVDSGKLTLRAVDAVTREELDRVRVRAANVDRIADRRVGPGQTEVALTLTPGAYSPLVLVPGYEPVELDVVRVDSGAEVELTAEMRRGSASIVGFVIGPALARHAELTGSGRHPCERCADSGTSDRAGEQGSAPTGDGWRRQDPCAHCGFAAAFTRIPVGPAGTFEFTGLGSGTYALRLTDDRGHSDGAPLLALLSEDEHLRVELRAPLLRDVLVDMIDVDHVSLAGAWSANVRYFPLGDEETIVSFEVAALVWRFGVLEGTQFFGRGEFSTPAQAGTAVGVGRAFSSRKRGTSARDDRERRADEELRPPAEAPSFPEVVLESSVGADGLVRISGVPASELTIRLTCEPFLATVTVPVSIGNATVRAQLERIADGTNVPATFRALDAARYR